MKFIVDHNVGKLVKWLRMLGYDTLFFTGEDDWEMVIIALREERIILTKDTGIMKRGAITTEKVKALLIASDNQYDQIRQVAETFLLDHRTGLFTRCMECNGVLEDRTIGQVKHLIPPHVLKTQKDFRQCPDCGRVYWKGTHWQAMNRKLAGVMDDL